MGLKSQLKAITEQQLVRIHVTDLSVVQGHSHPTPHTAGVDYDSGPKEVSFAASVTSPGSANTTFQTCTDNVFEGEEVFLLELMNDSDVGIGPDTGLVIIEDQTSEWVNWAASERGGVEAEIMCGLTSLLLVVGLSFGMSSYVVAEGNRVTVTLESDVAIEIPLKSTCPLWREQQMVSGVPLSREVFVSAPLLLSSAEADFTALTDVVVTFEPGTSAASVNISTIDDLVAESDETLHVTFVIMSTEATVKTGSISRAKVFIEDNEGACEGNYVCAMYNICLCVCMCVYLSPCVCV